MKRKLGSLLLAGGVGMVVFSCSGDTTVAPDPFILTPGPAFSATENFNDTGACLRDNQDRWGGGGPLNCTSNDIEIATAIVTAVDGQAFNPNEPIRCTGQTINLTMTALLDQTAQSDREDIGIWVSLTGNDAINDASCNHYNLLPGDPGTFNNDGDQCAGMSAQAETSVPLGEIPVVCEDPDGDGFLEIGACVTWEVPGQDGVCSDNRDQGIAPGTNASNESSDFRAATLPSTPAKCNCDPFLVPVIIQGTIIIEKQTVPNGATGTFDFQSDFDGSFSLQDDGQKTVNVDPGTYSVSEDDPTPAFDLTSIVCTDPSGGTTVNLGARSASLDVAPGETVKCTFTNTQRASITIKKETDPDGATGSFGFTRSFGAAFSLQDDGEETFLDLAPGSYTVTEDDPTPAFDLTSIVCTDPSGGTSVNLGTRTATIGLAAGENVTCTFTNTQRGSVIIEKQTLPDGAEGSFTFTQGIDATGNFSLQDNGTKTFANVTPGQYIVHELDPTADGFALTSIVCDDGASTTPSTVHLGNGNASVNVDPGETVKCTFTNSRLPRLIVEKQVVGGGTQVFDFTRNPGAVSFSLMDGQQNDSGFTLQPGTYRVCELDLAVSWAATATVNGAPATLINPDFPEDHGNRCVDVPLAYTDVKTVVWTNTPPPGGDARTIGYWRNWSSCTNGNQYKKATERNELDKTLDGNLPQTVGDLVVDNCEDAVNILSKRDLSGRNRASDAAYNLAAQLLAAKLNLSAGAGICAAASDAIDAGQALLESIDFDGTGQYLRPQNGALYTQANDLAAILDSYNNNTLCP